MVTIHLLITGEVQGVFFRATAKDVADKTGIKGWVRNTKEGEVEIVASGLREQLDRFVEWCKKGPKRALVSNVTVDHLEYRAFDDFRVIR